MLCWHTLPQNLAARALQLAECSSGEQSTRGSIRAESHAVGVSRRAEQAMTVLLSRRGVSPSIVLEGRTNVWMTLASLRNT